MADPVKRLHYFNGQFLREDDFTAEQEYHLRLRRLHNQLLHTWGIAEGLEVEFEAGATAVTVRQGTAFDSQGREIVLAENKAVELAGFPAGASIYVTIAYAEAQTDPTEETGAEGRTRWTEEPLIEASANAPSDPGQKLVLDLMARSGTEVTGQGEFPTGSPGRRTAGVVGGDLEVRTLTLTNPGVISTQWPSLHWGAANRADLEGSLRVTGNVNVGGLASFAGNVSIGATTPDTLLTLGDGTNRDLLKFINTAVGWKFTAGGSGTNTSLDLQALQGGKSFRVVSRDGNRVPLQVHTSDSEAINAVYLVQNGGNVGIGTTNPSAKLEVIASGASDLTGTARSATLLTSSGSLGTAAGSELALATIGFGSSGPVSGGSSSSLGIRALRVANGSDWVSTAIGLGMDVDNTVRAGASLWLNAYGNVGIGTFNPTNKLEIKTNSQFTGLLVSNATRPVAVLCGSSATNDDGSLNLYSAGAKTVQLVSNGGSFFNGGNIGIGTTNPSAKLEVIAPGVSELAGTARSTTLLTSAGSLGKAAGNELALATIGFRSNSNSGLGIRALRVANGEDWVSTAIGLGMDVDDTVRAGASLWLHANGNVGIGTTSPGAKLEVNGVIQGTPVAGRWYATNHGAGEGNYVWGTELINTNPAYLSRVAALAEIEVKIAGYYVVLVNVLQHGLGDGERGDVYLRRNGQTIADSLGTGNTGSQYYKHTLSIIELFQVGDKIGVYQASPNANVYGGDNEWSSLEIYRLN